MSLIGRVLLGQDGAETQARNNNTWFEKGLIMGGLESSSGVSVTPGSALTNPAVYACIRILSETLASLPLITYERKPNGRSRATSFYLYDLLHANPNPFMTSFEFREAAQGHLALWGNAYSMIDYNRDGEITSLFPLRPDRMLDIQIQDGQKKYLYQLPSNESRWLPGSRVWHLKLGGDGIVGASPVALMRNAIGLAMASEKFGSRFFSNGARPGGILQHPGELSEKARENIQKSWSAAHQGLDNAHRVAILEEGLQWQNVGMPLKDAQFLETRKYQKTEIASIYRIPPHMIADLEKATFSNIEHLSLEFVQYSMLPWFARWEQSITKFLLLPQERVRYYAEFLVDGLLRGDVQSRSSYYMAGKNWGWLSTNDIREKENMNPISGGDRYWMPLNMTPVSGDGSPSMVALADGARDATKTESVQLQDTKTIAASREIRADPGHGRYKLISVYRDLYGETASRILKRETQDLKRGIKKHLISRNYNEFRAWLDEFYRDHAEYIKTQLMPIGRSYSSQVSDLTSQEVDQDIDGDPVSRFTESYTGSYSARHSGISIDKIESTYNAAIEAGIDPEDALIEELDRWGDGRSQQIANEESVRFNNAVAKMIYSMVGIQYIRSIAFGDSCPYCKDLDGKIISINSNFLSIGEELQPEGVEIPLTTTTNLGHAPYHAGCDCMVISA